MIYILLDIQKDRFEAVEVFGIPALYTEERISRSTVPRGICAYDLQTSERDWTQPGLLARHVTDDHYGTVLTAAPVNLPPDGYLEMEPKDFNWPSPKIRPTVAEFAEQHGIDLSAPAKETVEKSVRPHTR